MSGIGMSDGGPAAARGGDGALREEGTLASVEIGQTVTISVVGGEGALRQHFLDMGVIPGAQITLEKYAPMGDPMEFSIHGYQLTLRIADARKIRVTTGACPVPAGVTSGRHKSIGHPGLGEDGLPDKVDVRTSDHSHPVPEGEVLRFALVGNFPGVTVDRKSGAIKGHPDTDVTDLPGIYSLSPYSPEELVSRQYILEEQPNAIINIVDATNIERNLYLTMQLMELDKPMVLALNMMDEVQGNGGTIDVNLMEDMLGISTWRATRSFPAGRTSATPATTAAPCTAACTRSCT